VLHFVRAIAFRYIALVFTGFAMEIVDSKVGRDLVVRVRSSHKVP